MFDSQGDQQLITVNHPGPKQSVWRLPLSYLTPSGPMAVETDDTTFVTAPQGFILFADKGLKAVYKISAPAFSPGVAYTAADGGPFVGRIDLSTGIITPIVTGLSNPGGMMFVSTAKSERSPSTIGAVTKPAAILSNTLIQSTFDSCKFCERKPGPHSSGFFFCLRRSPHRYGNWPESLQD